MNDIRTRNTILFIILLYYIISIILFYYNHTHTMFGVLSKHKRIHT